MTPPCRDRKTNADCPRRHVGCAVTCPEWAKYVESRSVDYEDRKRKCISQDFIRSNISRNVASACIKAIKMRRIKGK